MCLTCYQDIACNNGSTTVMRGHLKSKHPEAYRAMVLQDEEEDLREAAVKQAVADSDDDEDQPLARRLVVKTEKASGSAKPVKRTRSVRRKGKPASTRGPEDKSVLLSASEEVQRERRHLICDDWNLQMFSDASVFCGRDGGLIKTNRLFLSGLSKFLQRAFLDHSFTTDEEYIVLMPDVDSKVLYDFIDNVCMGHEKIAVIDPSLLYLGFGAVPDPDQAFGSDFIQPDNFNPQEPGANFFLEMNDHELSAAEEEDGNSFNHTRDADYEQPEDGNDDDVDDDDDDDVDYQVEEKKPAREKQQKRRKKEHQSLAWKFFVRLNDSLAKCTVCEAKIRGKRGSTTGMLTHVKSLHTDVYLAAAGEQGLTDVELKRKPRVKVKVEGGADEVEAKRGRPPKTKRSFIWSYFAPMESDESAMCFSCGDAFKTKAGNTTTLISHLRFKHPEVYEQVKVSQNEEHLVKARQKLLEVVPKSLDVFSQDRIGEAPLEMSQLAVRSSPIWTIFKPEQGNSLKAKCGICQKFLFRPENSTELLINHVRVEHPAAFDQILVQLESPDQPDPLDPASPIRDFYAISDQKYAQCKHCLEIVSIQESGNILVEHVTTRHPDIHLVYKGLCAKWQKERHEEFSVYQRNQMKNSNPLELIWNYFDKTSNKYEVICKSCQSVVLFSDQSLVEINEHIEQDHSDIYFQFLSDTTGVRVAADDDLAERTCPDCQKVFSRRSCMLIHRKTVHASVHPYQCHVCGKTFARPEAYRTHIHIRLKTYLCTHCGKQFTSSHKRNQHERAHFAEKGENPKNEKCTFCGKMFSFRHNRLRHEKLHRGEKPFQCTHCGKQFSQKHHLQAHLTTHTGEKPYSCNLCGKDFKFATTRNKHDCEGKRQRQSVPQQRVSGDEMPGHDEESSEGWE